MPQLLALLLVACTVSRSLGVRDVTDQEGDAANANAPFRFASPHALTRVRHAFGTLCQHFMLSV